MSDEGRADGRDRILADALIYYAERRPMNNPKGWDHVLRVVEDAIAKGVYGDGPHDDALSVLRALAAPVVAVPEAGEGER